MKYPFLSVEDSNTAYPQIGVCSSAPTIFLYRACNDRSHGRLDWDSVAESGSRS